ncbi:hypothetical protein GCM10010388_74740 [Streptomyces mauvecolor]
MVAGVPSRRLCDELSTICPECSARALHDGQRVLGSGEVAGRMVVGAEHERGPHAAEFVQAGRQPVRVGHLAGDRLDGVGKGAEDVLCQLTFEGVREWRYVALSNDQNAGTST